MIEVKDDTLDMLKTCLGDVQEVLELREDGTQASIYWTLHELKFIESILTDLIEKEVTKK